MMRPPVALLFAAIPVMAAAVPARADSRLFSVRTDQPDATIDQVLVNGRALKVAGKGGGLTFFRIDDPVGAVGCVQHFVVVASTGEAQRTDADLCARNWQLLIHLAGSAPAEPKAENAPPSGGPAASPPVAAAITAPTQPITIATDDPKIGIDAVWLDGEPMPLGGRQQDGVTISVPGGPGKIPCQRVLGLRLSDGRSIERKANICDHNWSVLAKLAGEEALPATPQPQPASAAPTSMAPSSPTAAAGPPLAAGAAPAAPPAPAGASSPEGSIAKAGPAEAVPPTPPSVAPSAPAATANAAPAAEADPSTPPAAPAAPPAPPSAPAAIASAVPAAPPRIAPPASAAIEAWSLEPSAKAVKLRYGAAGAMPRFLAGCVPGSGGVGMRVFQPGPEEQGAPLAVTLHAGDVARTYPAVRVPIPAGAEGRLLELWTSSADLLWQALVGQSRLEVQIGRAAAAAIPLPGGSGPLQVFLRACTSAVGSKIAAGDLRAMEDPTVAAPPDRVVRYGRWRFIIRGGRGRHGGGD